MCLFIHRSEIDRLTALLQSRSIDIPDGDEEKKSEVIPLQAVFSQNRKEFPNTPVKNNGIENCLISTPTVNSSVGKFSHTFLTSALHNCKSHWWFSVIFLFGRKYKCVHIYILNVHVHKCVYAHIHMHI